MSSLSSGPKRDDPSCAALSALIFSGVMVCLTGSILGLGLNGRFVQMPPPQPDFNNTMSSSTQSAASYEDVENPVSWSDGVGPPMMTYGRCLVDISRQEQGFLQPWCPDFETPSPIWGDPKHPACYPIGVPPWHPEDNIIVTFPDPADCQVAVSDSWQIAGWYTTYIQLAPNAQFQPPALSKDAESMIKLYRGSVTGVGENGIMRDDGEWETFVVTPPLMTRSLKVPHTTEVVQAGPNGAAFAWFVAPTALLKTPVTDMFSPPASTIEGPFSNLLEWRTFADRTNDNAFSPEFWNLAGILVRNSDGTRLAYNQWWTVREDDPVDGGYHNHAGMAWNSTFAELHMTLYAATASAGMQTMLPGTTTANRTANPQPPPAGQGTFWGRNDAPETQLVLPMPPGHVHGPLWAVDRDNGRPQRCPGGGVMYPFHRLVLGTNPDEGVERYHSPPRYHLWVAFEHPPEVSVSVLLRLRRSSLSGLHDDCAFPC
mmetsp:Transcript_40575/g.75226  ORF Transcript_40575/g.75226 Transcript_40575/m.75226 type:complete len:485 (-) Transcript_40575:332-1786(-)